MAFQPGNKMAVGGRKEKPFRDALMLAIKEAEDDKLKLRKVAEKLVAKAMDGDVAAIKEVADRLDGKVPQTNILQGDEDGGPVRTEKVERLIVDPANSNSPRLSVVS